MEQQTGLNPVEIMTDTAGTSDIIFGLFWLLGYPFSPRLADAGEAVFWRIDKNVTTVHWMNWPGNACICRRLKITGMK